MDTVSATEIQNNFGKYLKLVQDGSEILIVKNGKEIARLISYDKTVSFLTDSITGVLKKDYSKEDIKGLRTKKYEGAYWYKCCFRCINR